MRLFVGLEPPPAFRTALSSLQSRLQAAVVAARYYDPSNLHLTLAFIGDYPDAQPVLDALSTVRFTPFEIALDGVGRFGELWWAGLRDSAPLTAVARRVRRALAEGGIPFDRKRFSPHITLIRRASRDAAGIRVAPAGMRVRAISLMRSDRGKNGMRYTELGQVEAEQEGETAP